MKFFVDHCACACIFIFGLFLIATGLPVVDVESGNSKFIDPASVKLVGQTNTSDGSLKDLYVIKAVVYEIGILTDVSDEDNSTESSRERVDLTFYDAHTNGSYIDLGDIPLPVQTNVSGQILTGIAPVHIGAVQDVDDILATLPLTGTIVNITKSDTAYINLSTHNISLEDISTYLNDSDLTKIPIISNTIPLLADPEQDENSSGSIVVQPHHKAN